MTWKHNVSDSENVNVLRKAIHFAAVIKHNKFTYKNIKNKKQIAKDVYKQVIGVRRLCKKAV
jgi:hypothetical protein